MSIGDASVEEGETAQFTVTLSQAANETVTVEFQTNDRTAAAGDDYTQTSGTLTFNAGDRTKTISVQTTEDDTQESDEDFTVTLSNPTPEPPSTTPPGRAPSRMTTTRRSCPSETRRSKKAKPHSSPSP